MVIQKQHKELKKADKKDVSQRQKPKKDAFFYLTKIIREIIAVVFWLYVLLKVFIFDIDVFLIVRFIPEYTWLLTLKFFILIGVVAIVWLITKNKVILSWALYIFFYPVIILFWKIPFFVFKQRSWTFAFALINAVISFFKSIKYNFISLTVFLVALAIIFSASNEKLLWSATIMLLAFILLTYIHRFLLVFKPSSVFQMHRKIFSGIRKHGASSFALDKNIKNLSVKNLNQAQLEKWTTNLQISVLFNRICLFTAKKLRDYQNSRLNVISYVLTVLLLIVLTIFSFAAINYGFYKIDSNLFNLSSGPSFFTFFYYSFNNLIFNSIQEVTPIMPVSQAIFMIESFFALFLVAIFVSLLLSVRSQKHLEELNEVVRGIEEEGKSMESFIKSEYKMNSIDDAITELEKLKAGLISLIYKISENIK